MAVILLDKKMVINEIHIENVKGLQSFDLKQPIQPNRPNILVAPNGFGKTSLAVAFNSLKSNHLELDGANCYNGDDTNLPVLRLISMSVWALNLFKTFI